MTAPDDALEAARAHARERLAPLRDAARGVPGVLVGTGASFDQVRAALAEAIRDARCVIDGVPSAREWLRRVGWPALELPPAEGVPEVPSIYLALRELGCDPIVLAGVDGAVVDGVVVGSSDARRLEWAVETGPFRTIEDLHLASLRFGTDAPREALVEAVDCHGATVRIAESRRRDLAILELAIERDRARGKRVLRLDSRGAAIRGVEVASVETALPARAPVTIPATLLARVRERQDARAGASAPGAPGELAPAGRVRGGALSIEIRSGRRV
ncbi:MAG: hypothetical protein FJ253_12850, partial [Phycisphaerae bacterium]|nr:hypothetical protein [Phycisphaerae bacterium]